MIQMDPNNMPAGWVNLGYVALHVAKLRKFTTDLQRFIRWTPVATALQPLKAGSKEAWDLIDKECVSQQEINDLAETLRETASLQLHLAAELKDEKASRQNRNGGLA